MRTVDIILICYNQEQYIRQAVESILMQQVSADIFVRILVADDHSTDNTLVVIREIRNKKRDENEMFEWVFLPEEPNLGISLNYRRCFEAAKADYVAILEGDDYWSTANHLQQHVDFLAAHPECSMSMNRITKRWGDNPDLEEARWYGDNRPYHLVTLKNQIERGNQLGNLSACCFRASCLKNIPERIYSVHMDDFLLGILMAEQGNIGLLKETTSVYRGNPNSLWASRSNWSRFFRNMHFACLYNQVQEGKYRFLWFRYCWNIIREQFTQSVHQIKLSLKHIKVVQVICVYSFFRNFTY